MFTSISGIASGIVAGLLLVIFVGICMWAYSRRRRPAFEALSHLPLEEDDFPALASGGDTP
jgi:cytochrome c oxidase cbb3-type subunit 4